MLFRSSPYFPFRDLQSFFRCPFFPQFQHTIPDLDLDLSFLDLLKYPELFPLSIFLPLDSVLKALPNVSLELFHHISSLNIAPTTSSNFKVLDPETELLMAITKPFQLSGNEHKNNRALPSSSKFTPTELN